MSEALNLEVAQLYVALFGRAPDAEGLAYWAGLRSAGQSMQQVADTMFGTTPARTYFPTGLSNEEIISSLYENVLGRPADAAGLAFWTGKLNASGATPGSVIAEMIGVVAEYRGSDPAGIESAALFNNRVLVAKSYAEKGGSASGAQQALAGVTSDPASMGAEFTLSVIGAIGVIDCSGYASIEISGTSGDVHFANVMSGASVTIEGDLAMGYISFGPSANGAADSIDVTVRGGDLYATLHLGGYEYVSIHSVDTEGFTTPAFHAVELTARNAVSIQVQGSVDFGVLANDVGGTLDASGVGGQFSYQVKHAGSTFPPIITGSPGDDYFELFGGAAEHVDGGAGRDWFAGSNGGDVLTGGLGADIFKPTLRGRDHFISITDFSQGDHIQLASLVIGNSLELAAVAVAVNDLSSFVDCLNAGAASAIGFNDSHLLNLVHFRGDTYLVIDNGASTTFEDGGTDSIVKLNGLFLPSDFDLRGMDLYCL